MLLPLLQLLAALVPSGSSLLLEVLMNVMCRETKHVHEDQIQSSLVHYIKGWGDPYHYRALQLVRYVSLPRIPTALEKKQAINIAYQFFTNERDYPIEARRAAAERVCLTLMRSCDEVALREFFLSHIEEIMTVIEASLSKVYTSR